MFAMVAGDIVTTVKAAVDTWYLIPKVLIVAVRASAGVCGWTKS
jgi:hypothetical protein